MKDVTGKVIGIIIVLIGIALLGNYLWDLNVFFKGWWTLLIIIPSLIGAFTKKDKVLYLVILLIGILLLLDANDCIGDIDVWNIVFAIIIINIGLNVAFKEKTRKYSDKKMCAVFGGTEEKFNKEEYNGNDLVAVFGGIELDLRDAIIKDGTTINAVAIFGGIDIFVPDDVKVKIDGLHIFGGVENKSSGTKKTLNINTTCIFGGIDIK